MEGSGIQRHRTKTLASFQERISFIFPQLFLQQYLLTKDRIECKLPLSHSLSSSFTLLCSCGLMCAGGHSSLDLDIISCLQLSHVAAPQSRFVLEKGTIDHLDPYSLALCFDMGFTETAQLGFELTLQPSQNLNLMSSCFSFLSSGIIDVYNWAWLR